MTGKAAEVPSEGESRRTVIVAMAANLGIAAAKMAAALLTGSSAMLAEAFHAIADAGNQALLLIAQRRAAHLPDELHPMGYGREAYFWALMAALGVFVTGALLSIREGIHALGHAPVVKSYPIAYAILFVSLGLESLSLWRASEQIKREAGTLKRGFVEHLDRSSDPIARAVFAEDAVAVLGNVLAFAGIALHQATGSALPDAIAAIAIGCALALVAFDLTRRNREFLIGRGGPPALRARVEAIIASRTGIRGVHELVVSYLGPRRMWVVAHVNVDDALDARTLKQLFRQITETITRELPWIVRVDLVPCG
jgi:cation diffusion facilitator family transporter